MTRRRTCRGHLARVWRGHLGLVCCGRLARTGIVRVRRRRPVIALPGLRGQDARVTRGRDALATSPRRRTAFTLLEMLVAITMMAMLAGSLYASIRVAFRARASALGAVETARKFQWSMELIKADLQAALVPGGTLAGTFTGTSGAGFGSGGATGLDVLNFGAAATDVEPDVGIGDVKRVEYTCEDAGGGSMMLVRHLTTNLLPPVTNTTTTSARDEVICRGVRRFMLRYYDGAAWQESWDSSATTPANVLPLAVEVTIELDDSGGGQILTQVMSIPCGQDSSNAFGAAGGG